MARLIFKTIVSSEYELPFVLMNLYEFGHAVDFFLITEANVNHVGESKEYRFENVFIKHIAPKFPNAKYVRIDLQGTYKHATSSTDAHKIENAIRDGFRNHIPDLSGKDVIISVDGDEVIHNCFQVKAILFFLRFYKLGKPKAFSLRLHQFMFFLNLLWDHDVDFPTIAHVGYYLNMKNPAWRGGGRRLKRRLGCHFSWVMSEQQMLSKILSYGHRFDLMHLADIEVLKMAKREKINIFDSTAITSNRVIDNHKRKPFPKHIAKIEEFISPNNIINVDKFWT